MSNPEHDNASAVRLEWGCCGGHNGLPNLEGGQPLHGLVANVHRRHPGLGRTETRPLHQPLDALRLALEDSFDAAVRQIAYPTGNTLLPRDSAARVAIEDALYLAGHQNPLADHRITL
jgi:hypothetical protein